MTGADEVLKMFKPLPDVHLLLEDEVPQ